MTIRAAEPGDLEPAQKIFLEYARSLPSEHICFVRFEQELTNLGQIYSHILLAVDGSELAGCVALRALSESDCEIKRLYVRPRWRGQGLGRMLVQEAIGIAQKNGFEAMKLDTLPEFKAAFTLYEQFGFERIEAYSGQPPEVICMRLKL